MSTGVPGYEVIAIRNGDNGVFKYLMGTSKESSDMKRLILTGIGQNRWKRSVKQERKENKEEKKKEERRMEKKKKIWILIRFGASSWMSSTFTLTTSPAIMNQITAKRPQHHTIPLKTSQKLI
eukprot:324743_1